MRTPRPAAGPTLALFELFLGPTDPTCSSRRLFCVFHPADELVSRQGGDIPPDLEHGWLGEQRRAEVRRELVHHPAGNALAAHEKTVAVNRDTRDSPRCWRADVTASADGTTSAELSYDNSTCTTVRSVGLFRRRSSRAHIPNDILEEDAEMHETAGSSLLGPGALDFDASPLGVQPRRDRQSDVEELRANADPEDDGTEEEFIASERRDDEGRN